MTIIQVILSLSALGLGFLVLSSFKRPVFLKVLVSIATVVAILLIINPDYSNRVAEWVGVERGVDVVIYLAIAFFLFLHLRLYVKVRKQRADITTMVRENAISRAMAGAQQYVENNPDGQYNT